MVDSFKWERIPLRNGIGQIPVLGFGTLIADPEAMRIATGDALEAGFRHFDCAERYRNEREVSATPCGPDAGKGTSCSLHSPHWDRG
jgi:alcohol dehydrogenase (NADP+)